MKQRKQQAAAEEQQAAIEEQQAAAEEQQAAAEDQRAAIEEQQAAAEEQQAAIEEQRGPATTAEGEQPIAKKTFRYRVQLLHANNSKEEITKEVLAASYDESLQLLESQLLAMRGEEPGLRWRIVS